MAKKSLDLDFVKDSVASLIDIACDKFSEVSGEKNSSLTVLGKNSEGLVVEVSYPNDDGEYNIEHIVLKMISKRKLIPNNEIDMFKSYLEEKNNK